MVDPDVINELEIIDFSGFTPDMTVRYQYHKKIADENGWAITWVNYQMFKEFGGNFDKLRTCVANGYTGESILPSSPTGMLSADDENLDLGSEWEEKEWKYNPHKRAKFTTPYDDDDDEYITPEYKAFLRKWASDYVNGRLPPRKPSESSPPPQPEKTKPLAPKQTNLFE